MSSAECAGGVSDVVSEFVGEERRAGAFRVVVFPRGCAAAYYALVPLRSVAGGSNTPVSKAVVIRLERP